MNAVRLATLLLIGFWSISGNAADVNFRNMDCAQILERWAENPASVPKRLVDACKEQLAAVPAPAAVAAAPLAAPVDPCAGPNAAASVLCWGPWATLAPAAAAPVAALEIPDIAGDCRDYGSDISDQCVALLEPLSAPVPEPPLEGCAPGAPCGFATLVDGFTSTGDVEDTSFKKFDLAPDGTRFTVDPGGDNEIQSVAMTTSITNQPDDYENLYAEGIDGTDESYLEARIVRDEEQGDIQLAADVWTRANSANSALNKSGYFAWGIATSQSGLNLLNGNGVSVAFSGPMSVNNATNAYMTVNFGSQPNWTGTWTNTSEAWSFGAGGSVNGVNLISSPGQFTSNVQQGGVVQGALLGEPGRQGIAHIVDVTLDGKGHYKDVGLLREITSGPGIGTGVSP